MHKPRTLSSVERGGLVVGLWLFLLLIALVARNNLPILFSHLPSLGVACLSVCGVVIIFSMLAAAVRISVDVARGKYPYNK